MRVYTVKTHDQNQSQLFDIIII